MTNDDISVAVQEPEEIHFIAEYAEIIKAISPTIDVESTPEKTTLIITDINGTKRVEIPHYNEFPPSGVTWGDLLGRNNQEDTP